jgi:hypothetical protein
VTPPKTLLITHTGLRTAFRYYRFGSPQSLLSHVRSLGVRLTEGKLTTVRGCYFCSTVIFDEEPGVRYRQFNICVSGPRILARRLMIHECSHAAAALSSYMRRHKQAAKRCPRAELLCYAAEGLSTLGLEWLDRGCPEAGLPLRFVTNAVQGLDMCRHPKFWTKHE